MIDISHFGIVLSIALVASCSHHPNCNKLYTFVYRDKSSNEKLILKLNRDDISIDLAGADGDIVKSNTYKISESSRYIIIHNFISIPKSTGVNEWIIDGVACAKLVPDYLIHKSDIRCINMNSRMKVDFTYDQKLGITEIVNNEFRDAGFDSSFQLESKIGLARRGEFCVP